MPKTSPELPFMDGQPQKDKKNWKVQKHCSYRSTVITAIYSLKVHIPPSLGSWIQREWVCYCCESCWCEYVLSVLALQLCAMAWESLSSKLHQMTMMMTKNIGDHAVSPALNSATRKMYKA